MTAPPPDPEPTATPTQASPHVGIFWRVRDATGAPHLAVDITPLAAAEPYGDFLTHPRGHHEVWTDWRRRGSRFLTGQGWPLTILSAEYEDHPRGRVVLHRPTKTFWLYADRRLQGADDIAAIKAALGLTTARCLVKSDDHYR